MKVLRIIYQGAQAKEDMARKKTKLDVTAVRLAEMIQAHLDTLPRAQAQAMRKEIHTLAVKPSRSVGRGKASRTRKTSDPRLLSRICAESA